MMHIVFMRRWAGPERLAGEAEVVFDDGALAGLRLKGFSLWRGSGTDTHLTFPSRAVGAGANRVHYDYLQGDEPAIQRFKEFVVAAFREWEQTDEAQCTAEPDKGDAPS